MADSLFWATLVLISGDIASVAEPVGRSRAFESCVAKSRGVQAAYAACVSDEAARVDRLLNVVYRRARARLDEPGRARLLTAQRRWLRQRDRDCDRRYREEAPAQDASVLFSRCLIELNSARVGELGGMRR